nr:EamA family transporter [uncultured Holophaga sp.]
MREHPARAWTAYGICAVVWGSTYFAIALAVKSFTPFGMVSARFILGGLIALGASRLRREDWPLRHDLPHLVLQGILLLGLSNALVSWAETRVPSGLTAIICSSTPIFYALMGRERIGPRTWVGLGLGLAGVALLCFRPGQHLDPLGILAILAGVYLWAYGTLHGRRHVKGQGLFGQVSVQMLAGGVTGVIFAFLTGGFTHQPVTWSAGLAVAYLMVFGSLVAFSAYAYLSRVWPPTRMGTYNYLNPLVAVALGSVFLHEPFGARTVLGMAIILGGVALVQPGGK